MSDLSPFEPWVEVFVGPNGRVAGQRALVLQARGIPHRLVSIGRGMALHVPTTHAEEALAELASYERENVGWPPPRPAPPMLSTGVSGAVVYAAILLAFVPIARAGFLGRNWWDSGKLVAGRVVDGEWWRAATALCLHGDAAHVIGNLVFGAGFGVLAAHTLGLGLTWFGTLAAGFLGNAANAALQDPSHTSIGASTAVFGCLGLMAAYEWVRRRDLALQPMRRLAPVLAAAALLGFFGAGGANEGAAASPRTDVVAHVTGMACGAVLGVLVGWLRLPARISGRAQSLLAWSVPALLAVAWAAALR